MKWVVPAQILFGWRRGFSRQKPRCVEQAAAEEWVSKGSRGNRVEDGPATPLSLQESFIQENFEESRYVPAKLELNKKSV